jgi:hypothetical protein
MICMFTQFNSSYTIRNLFEHLIKSKTYLNIIQFCPSKKFSFVFQFWFISSWNRTWPILSMWCSPWKFKTFLFGLSYIHTKVSTFRILLTNVHPPNRFAHKEGIWYDYLCPHKKEDMTRMTSRQEIFKGE